MTSASFFVLLRTGCQHVEGPRKNYFACIPANGCDRRKIIAIINPPYFLIEFEEVLTLFGAFLLVLIGIELLDTIKIYFRINVVHVEVVVLVAIIAITRKVIVLEPVTYDGVTLTGIAAIILSLALSYYLIKKLGSEMINFRDLPSSSRKVIADDIKEMKEDLIPGDIKVDFSESPSQLKDLTGEDSNIEKDIE